VPIRVIRVDRICLSVFYVLRTMSNPAEVKPQTRKRGALWLWVLGGVLIIGLWFAARINHPALQPVAEATKWVTNAAEAVSLGEFTQVETRRWHSIPHGTQVCDGVTFICNGAIRTAGLTAAREGNHYPGAVLGVPIDRRGARLHLLQAAENGSEMLDGTPYGRMVLHYANGESRRFDLLFGIHGDDWSHPNGAPNEPVADPNSTVAWLQRRTGGGPRVRLYHTTLENPLPEITITRMDFISPLTEANLLLFGLAINDDARPLAPSYGPGERIGDAPSEPVMFTLLDATGQPATGATLGWTIRASRIRVDFPPFPADLRGQVVIDVPRRLIVGLQYKASAPNGSTAVGELKPNADGSLPLTPVVKLE